MPKKKTVMKFDTGRDGFEMMIIVLAISAVVLLILGIYFIVKNF